MSLYVQKFGGSSLATIEHVRFVAERIKQRVMNNDRVVVVVSAMQGDTDRLLSLAYTHSHDQVSQRELASLVVTGEQVSASLLAMALISIGVNSVSLNAFQCGIRAKGSYKDASVSEVDSAKLQGLLEEGTVPVITGFQAISSNGDLMTIGRGGSDLTAVALAYHLSADECQIFTDVNGVYTADPHVVSDATVVPQLTYAEMLELSKHGAKVLQYRSVEYAARFQVPLRVCHSRDLETKGTQISSVSRFNKSNPVAGIVLDRDQIRIQIKAPLSELDYLQSLPDQLARDSLDVDMYRQHQHMGSVFINFTVHLDNYHQALVLVNNFSHAHPGLSTKVEKGCAKISLVGLSMKRHAHLASRVFSLLELNAVKIDLFSLFHHRVSLLMAVNDLEKTAQLLHREFLQSSVVPAH
jgi:aspartate kinase